MTDLQATVRMMRERTMQPEVVQLDIPINYAQALVADFAAIGVDLDEPFPGAWINIEFNNARAGAVHMRVL